MIKINYPSSRTKRTEFENAYLNIWDLDLSHYQTKLKHLLNSSPRYKVLLKYSFKDILIASFEKLHIISNEYKAANFSTNDIREIKSIFNYDYKKDKHRSYGAKFSDKIASFFRDWSNDLNLSTCFFCNIDFINSYSTLEDHIPLLDFLNSANQETLEYINGISPKIAYRIYTKDFTKNRKARFTHEDDLLDIKGISKTTQKKILDFYRKKNEFGNFTLDHIIDKGDNPVLALSLYNFVPSCYVCNSKVKTTHNLITATSKIELSPTHKKFSFNKDVRFKLILKEFHTVRDLKPADIKCDVANKLHLDIDAKNGYQEYVEFFRLKGRYQYHTNEAIKLVELKKKYSKTHITKICKLFNNKKTNPTILKTITKDIFGKEIFDGDLQEKPFTKL